MTYRVTLIDNNMVRDDETFVYQDAVEDWLKTVMKDWPDDESNRNNVRIQIDYI